MDYRGNWKNSQSQHETFADTDIGRFRTLLAEQLCALSGGPCVYSGGTMQESHTGFNISLADYDARDASSGSTAQPVAVGRI